MIVVEGHFYIRHSLMRTPLINLLAFGKSWHERQLFLSIPASVSKGFALILKWMSCDLVSSCCFPSLPFSSFSVIFFSIYSLSFPALFLPFPLWISLPFLPFFSIMLFFFLPFPCLPFFFHGTNLWTNFLRGARHLHQSPTVLLSLPSSCNPTFMLYALKNNIPSEGFCRPFLWLLCPRLSPPVPPYVVWLSDARVNQEQTVTCKSRK